MDFSSTSERDWLSNSAATSSSGAAKIELLEDEDDGRGLELGGGGGGERGAGAGAETSVGEGSVVAIEREHMFDKVVTPSDVGKLNRLVIPKQHAEKYFPLDATSNEKGLLLNFEDRTGKPWRFRYSYWNSSQSYVMTKGWSRFVKEKKLDAGDIVSFQRGVGEVGKDKLFIDWRRRPDPHPPLHHHQQYYYHHPNPGFSIHRGGGGGGSGSGGPYHQPVILRSHLYQPHPYHTTQGNTSTNTAIGGTSFWDHGANTSNNSSSHLSMMINNNLAPSQSHPHNLANPPLRRGYACGFGTVVNNHPYPYPQAAAATGSLVFLAPSSSSSSSSSLAPHRYIIPSSSADHHQEEERRLVELHGDGYVCEPMVFDSVPVVQGNVAAKRLRLFGVTMDCPPSESSSTSASASSNMANHHHFAQLQQHSMAFGLGPPSSSSSPSENDIPRPPQLRLYNGTPVANPEFFVDKGKSPSSSSSMSLDLDI